MLPWCFCFTGSSCANGVNLISFPQLCHIFYWPLINPPCCTVHLNLLWKHFCSAFINHLKPVTRHNDCCVLKHIHTLPALWFWLIESCIHTLLLQCHRATNDSMFLWGLWSDVIKLFVFSLMDDQLSLLKFNSDLNFYFDLEYLDNF